VTLQVIAHVAAWAASSVYSTGGWAKVGASITGSPMVMYGFIVS
jgi:hypothetical protein